MAVAIDPRTLADILRQKANLDAIQDARQRALVQAWITGWSEIEADLRRTLDALAQDTAKGVVKISRRDRLKLQRQAIQIASGKLTKLLRDAGVIASTDATRMIRQAEADALRTIRSQLPESTPDAGVHVTLTGAQSDQLDAIVKRTTEQITARHYFLSQAATDAMKAELTRTLAAGDNPKLAARRMLARVGGVFNGGLPRAMVIARTEQLDAYRTASKLTHDANSDILAGWQWVATLGPRTCPSCIAKHGSMHPLDEPGPEDHQQGRCVRAPVTKSWKELGFQTVDEPARLPQDAGIQWFNQQPEAVQRDILGKSRYEAWKAGQFPPDKWSELRHTDGWRDSWHVGKPPEPPKGGWPTASGGAGGDGKPPEGLKAPEPGGNGRGGKKPPPPYGVSLTPEHPDWDHWRQRQNALISEISEGRLLEPREIMFTERVEAQGIYPRWLPLGGIAEAGSGRLPSNDFVWPPSEHELEHKAPKTVSLRAAKDAIRKDRKTAWENHGIDKGGYMVDYGDRYVPDQILRGLARYLPERPLLELWVAGDFGQVRLV